MTYPSASLIYRRASTQQASAAGLVIALYDTLAGDLSRAASAMEQRNIQTRCDQLTHGFAVLQHLEMMIDCEHGGTTATSLQRFYRHIRGQMLQAQFKLSPEILREQVQIVLEVRQAWQQIDASAIERTKVDPVASTAMTSKHAQADPEVRISFSC